MPTPFPTVCRWFAAVAAVLILNCTSGVARDASPWHKGAQASVRLIAGSPPGEPETRGLRAGVEIRLAPGWKTYWRYPGDAGVAPRFDFAGSRNVADVSVMWPAPIRFDDGGGTSIGYADFVVFPLRVIRANPDMPAVLHLKLDFAVCEKLCVPDGAEVELELSGAHFAHDAALTASEGRVPVRADLAAPGPLSIVSMRREHRGSRRVIVDVRAPDSSYIDLFVEGPSTDWSLPLPENISGAPPGLHRFAFTLDGLPPGLAPEGAALTLTAITRSHAVEVIAHLD